MAANNRSTQSAWELLIWFLLNIQHTHFSFLQTAIAAEGFVRKLGQRNFWNLGLKFAWKYFPWTSKRTLEITFNCVKTVQLSPIQQLPSSNLFNFHFILPDRIQLCLASWTSRWRRLRRKHTETLWRYNSQSFGWHITSQRKFSPSLNSTINKYFIIVKYFCLLLLNRWIPLLPTLASCSPRASAPCSTFDCVRARRSLSFLLTVVMVT